MRTADVVDFRTRDADVFAAHAGLALEHEDNAAVFIASVPLTDEAWQPLQKGELMAVRDGEVIATRFAVQSDSAS